MEVFAGSHVPVRVTSSLSGQERCCENCWLRCRCTVWLRITRPVGENLLLFGVYRQYPVSSTAPAPGAVLSHLQHTHCDSHGEAGRRQDFLGGVLEKSS